MPARLPKPYLLCVVPNNVRGFQKRKELKAAALECWQDSSATNVSDSHLPRVLGGSVRWGFALTQLFTGWKHTDEGSLVLGQSCVIDDWGLDACHCRLST